MARTLPALPAHLADARIQLPWGGQPLVRTIALDTGTQAFQMGNGFDVSEWIPEGWVRYWPGFDLESFNIALSNRRLNSQGRYVSDLGPTGTVSAFFNGVWNDVRAIGDGVRRAYNTLGNAAQNLANAAEDATKPLNLTLIVGIGVALYFVLRK